MDYLSKYPEATNQLACSPQQETVRTRLERKKVYLAGHLAEVTAALSLLDANPGFETLQDAITRAL